jgi:DNA adenine methylase
MKNPSNVTTIAAHSAAITTGSHPTCPATRNEADYVCAPFLKWVGSKRRLLPQLLALLPKGRRLIEPFVGAGSVFMGSDYQRYMLADTNAVLMGLYVLLQSDPSVVLTASKGLFVESNRCDWAYHTLRSRYNDPATSDFERCVLLIYLNKFAFNGLYRTNRRGMMNAPYAHHARLPGFPAQAMQGFAQKLGNPNAPVELICAGFEETMARAQPGDVVYCDPPYLPLEHGRACFTAYGTQSFGLDSHQRLTGLALELANQGITVVISNHDSRLTRELYAGATLHKMRAHRSLAAHQSARGDADELVAVFTP